MLQFAYGQYPMEVLSGYFRSAAILVMNAIPVVLLIFFFCGMFGRAWLAYILGTGISLGLNLGNYYKLYFRGDPMYLEDLLLIREAKAMTFEQDYNLFLNQQIILTVICLAFGGVIAALLVRGVMREKKLRLKMIASVIVCSVLLCPIYMSKQVYNAIENYEHLNRWNPTQNYISHGFCYPFVHSIAEYIDIPPRDYHRKEVEKILSGYKDENISKDKQVNVIAVMRESYVDFSKYHISGLRTDDYEFYHELAAESYTGTLMVNAFAGGTIDSERGFLTGNYLLKNFRGNSNSYLWYFKDQGYTVEGSHPYYNWFYNRKNVNEYLGFERYRFYEDDYGTMTDASLPEDAILYPEVYADFVANKETGKPYFSFVLNVQSHGPYSTENYEGDIQYLSGNYSKECKNAMNNYMASIMGSDVELAKFVENLRNDSAPIVLVLYGDHMPWMGAGNEFYEEMGLDIELDTEEGFRNHFSTEYLIWANDTAKQVLGKDFIGEGPTISPCYLMNLLFEQCGWERPAFMQAMDDMRDVFSVVTTRKFYVVDGKFTDEIPLERIALFRKFEALQYYWKNNFIY